MTYKQHFLILILLLVTSSCYRHGAKQEEMPKVLYYGISTLEEDPDLALHRHDPIKEYIEKETGLKVKIVMTSGYASLIEALKSKKVDICSMGAFSYIIAADRAGVEAIATLGTLDGKQRTYNSIMITNVNKPIYSLEDVMENASQYTIAFSDPASTSGHLIPKSYLKSIGLEPGSSFKEEVFATSHGAVVMTTLSGKIDIGCCSLNTFTRLTATNKINPNDFRILWTSDPIIYSGVAVRKDLPPTLKEEIARAFTSFRFENPDGWGQYASRIQKSTGVSSDSLTYIPAYDSMYNYLRDISTEFNIYEFIK